MEQIQKSIEKSQIKLNEALDADNPTKIKNTADDFLSVGTDKKKNAIYWDYVYKELASSLFSMKSTAQTFTALKSTILTNIGNDRKTKELKPLIEQVYMQNNGFRNITPLSYLLLENEKGVGGKTAILVRLLKNMLSEPKSDSHCLEESGNNILERVLIEQFKAQCEVSLPEDSGTVYLPFLAKVFTEDLHKLTSNAAWFAKDFEAVIRLYSFLYVSQLALHLRYSIADKPKSERLYFLLEQEQASKERIKSVTYGFESIFGHKGAAYKLFPYLSYLNLLTNAYKDNPPPFWQIVEDHKVDGEKGEIVAALGKMNQTFSQLFGVSIEGNDDDSLIDHIKTGLKIQKSTFSKSSKKSQRAPKNKNVFDSIKTIYAAGFYRSRGPAGTFLELKADVVLLLTNLIIGSGEKMLIGDVVAAFKARGIWLDIQSKQALIAFYENIGNVDKLSDSGEAVYVKSTI